MDSPMKKALEVFERTRFAFIPILIKKEDKMDDLYDSFKVVTASLAIRDILPLIAKANLNISIRELSSRLIVAFTEIGNNFVYLHGLHFPVSFLYTYQI